MRTVIYPQWLIDGTGAPALEGHALAFDTDGRIEAVDRASELAPREGDTVVRAPGACLLPGLINMHAHLTLHSDNAPFIPYMDGHSDVALALRAAFNASASRAAGVTTVRDCGSRGRTVLDVRDARSEGLVATPRILAAGWALTISGGHMRPFGGEVDGVDGVRQMVRRLVSAGADFVKVAGSGGGTPGSLADYASFSVEELRAVVETAHGLGRRVTVHCTATAAIERAAAAGVDSIEHGYFGAPGRFDAYDEALADRLAEAGISVTPTLQVFRDMAELLPQGPERDRWRQRLETLVRNVGRLHRAGVRLTAGSDAGWRLTRFENFSRKLEQLASCGLSALDVIHAASGAAASATGREAEFGTLRPGLAADLLLVDGNPAADVRCLAAVQQVFLRRPTPAASLTVGYALSFAIPVSTPGRARSCRVEPTIGVLMSPSSKEAFDRDGCVVAHAMFPPAEVAALREHFMSLRKRGAYAHDLVGVQPSSNDPLRRYPRMAQMHRWDITSLRWLLDPRLGDCLTTLLGVEPYAVQTMLYFKPPGSRGQALHQDNFYLRVQPGTCIAAWLALDHADEANGCMLVVPGSQRWPILCTRKADTRLSFTDVTVPIPDGQEVRAVEMAPGDVLFFHGSLVHGSMPNTTADRFRRALIGHYIQADAQQVAEYYHPALRMDGTLLELGVSEGGGACGEWIEQDGIPTIVMTGQHSVSRKHE